MIMITWQAYKTSTFRHGQDSVLARGTNGGSGTRILSKNTRCYEKSVLHIQFVFDTIFILNKVTA